MTNLQCTTRGITISPRKFKGNKVIAQIDAIYFINQLIIMLTAPLANAFRGNSIITYSKNQINLNRLKLNLIQGQEQKRLIIFQFDRQKVCILATPLDYIYWNATTKAFLLPHSTISREIVAPMLWRQLKQYIINENSENTLCMVTFLYGFVMPLVMWLPRAMHIVDY